VGWVRRLARALVFGALEALMLAFLYLYLFPTLAAYALGPYLGGAELGFDRNVYIAFIGVLVGLSTTARALEGTVFQPIFQAASNFFAFLVFSYYIAYSGTVRVEGISVGPGAVAAVELDLRPMALAAGVFLLAPSVVNAFVSYFFRAGDYG